MAKLDPAFAQARQRAADPKAAPADRLAAIRILGRGPGDPAGDRAILVELLGPQSSSDVQSAAVAALARSAAADTPATLLKGWKAYSPAVRASVLAALLAREAWMPAVLAAIEKKEVLPAEVDAAARQQLLTHKAAAVRDRAGQLFGRRDRRGPGQGDRRLQAGADQGRRPRPRQAGVHQDLRRLPQGSATSARALGPTWPPWATSRPTTCWSTSSTRTGPSKPATCRTRPARPTAARESDSCRPSRRRASPWSAPTGKSTRSSGPTWSRWSAPASRSCPRGWKRTSPSSRWPTC